MKNDFSVYDEFKKFLKKYKKKFADIKFIIVYDEDDDDEEIEYEIDIKDFKKYSKKIDAIDISDMIVFVGDDWWITTDTEGFDSYFEFYSMPKKPKKKINLAKELLLDNNKDAIDILRLRFNGE